MPIYKYDNSSLIDEVTIIKNANGGTRAYLHADAKATHEQLGETMRKLMDSGYLSVPYEFEGKPVLEIRGFGKEEVLLDTLKTTGLTNGSATKNEIEADKIPLFEKLKKKSLIASALLYLVGDAAYIKYEKVANAVKEQEKSEKLGKINSLRKDKGLDEISYEKSPATPWDWLAGYGYLAGSTTSLASMLLQKDPSEEEISKASKTFMKAAVSAGIDIGNDETIAQLANKKDTRGALRKTFTKYPAELMNLSFATAGVAITRGSYHDLKDLNKDEDLYPELFKDNKRHKEAKQVAKLDVALGIGTAASGVVSSFVKETPHDPSKPRKKGLAGVGEFLKEKPLRIAGYGYLVSTIIHLVSSIKERKSIIENNKLTGENNSVNHTTFRLIFVISNLIAEVVMSMSSKGHGNGVKSDESVDKTTCAMVADMIYKKPKDMREDLVERMSEFLSMPDALGTSQDKLKTIINEQLESLDKNPWVAATNNKKDPIQATETNSANKERTNHLERAVASKKEAENEVNVLR